MLYPYGYLPEWTTAASSTQLDVVTGSFYYEPDLEAAEAESAQKFLELKQAKLDQERRNENRGRIKSWEKERLFGERRHLQRFQKFGIVYQPLFQPNRRARSSALSPRRRAVAGARIWG